MGFIFGAVGKLYSVVPILGGVPLLAALLPASIDVMAAFSYRRGAPNPDPEAAEAAEEAGAPVQAAMVSGFLFCVLAGASARTLRAGDTQIYPGAEGLWGYHLVLARYFSHLSRSQRLWALAGSVSIAGTAATLRSIRLGEHVDTLSALDAGIASVLPFVATIHLGERQLAQVAAADEAMAEASAAAIDAARADGVRAEARRFLEWVDAAQRALGEIRGIPEPQAARLRGRFEEARAWLATKTWS